MIPLWKKVLKVLRVLNEMISLVFIGLFEEREKYYQHEKPEFL